MTALEQPSQVMSTKNSCFWKEKRQLRGQGGHSWKHTTSNCSPHLPFSLGWWVQSLPSQKVHTHPTKGSSAKTKSSWYSSLWCPCAVCHSIILRGLWRLSGYLQSQHRLPSPWPLLDSLSLPRGAHEKQISCLQLVTDLSLQGFQCFSTLFFLHLQGFWSPK